MSKKYVATCFLFFCNDNGKLILTYGRLVCSKREAARVLSLNRAAMVRAVWNSQKMAPLKGKILFVGFLTMQTIVEGKTPTFRVNAGSFMSAGYQKVIRGGELRNDVTSIEVTARLHRMVERPMDIDTDRVSVEIKTGVDMNCDIILLMPNKHEFCLWTFKDSLKICSWIKYLL